MTFYYGRDVRGEWRWQLRAANGRIIATSGEGYHNEDDCVDAIALVKSTREARLVKVERIS